MEYVTGEIATEWNFSRFHLCGSSALGARENGPENPITPAGITGEHLPLTGFGPLYIIFGDPVFTVQLSFKYRFLEKEPLFFGYNPAQVL